MLFNKIIAWFERQQAPGYGWCKCCRRPWTKVKAHDTWYSAGRGCSPLCRECWKSLTPADRLPYYRELWLIWWKSSQEWNDDDDECTPWEVIRAACLYERDYEPVSSLEEGLRRIAAEPDQWQAVTGDSPYFLKPTLPPELVNAWAVGKDGIRARVSRVPEVSRVMLFGRRGRAVKFHEVVLLEVLSALSFVLFWTCVVLAVEGCVAV